MSDEFFGVMRAHKWGKSMVLVLPPELREFFGVVHRDLIGFRKVGRHVLLRRIRAGEVMPVSEKEAQDARSGVEVDHG